MLIVKLYYFLVMLTIIISCVWIKIEINLALFVEEIWFHDINLTVK